MNGQVVRLYEPAATDWTQVLGDRLQLTTRWRLVVACAQQTLYNEQN